MEERTYHNMKFSVKGRTLLIELAEDLDHHNAVFVREVAEEMQERYPVNTVVFDFRGVEFMDSSGIGVIMGRYRHVAAQGGCIKVAGIGKSVNRIFELSGLYKLVKKYDTVEAALR